MKRNVSLHFIHQYIVTAFMWLLIIVILNLLNGLESNALSYGLIVIGILISYNFFFTDKGRRFIYVMFPVAFILMWFLDYHWLAALIGAFLPIVKLEYLHHDEQASRPEMSIVISFVIIMTLNFISFDIIADYMMWLYLIVIGQVIYYFVGRFVVLMYKNGRATLDNIKIFSISIFSFIALGLAFGLSFRYVIHYGTYVVLFLINGFIFLLRPIFDSLENVELEYPTLEEDPDEVQEGELSQEEITETPNEMSLNIPFEMIAVIALIIIVAGLLVMYFMRRGDLSRKVGMKDAESNTVQHVSPVKTKHRFKSSETPDDKVRKVYFEFEKWLAENNIGRYKNETISDWLKRHDFVDIIDPIDFDTYRKTRYYGERVNEDEFKAFVERMDEIKTELTRTYLKPKPKSH